MGKILSELLKDIDVLEVKGDKEIEIANVLSDSRKAGEGSLFVAVRGVETDAHRFIPGLRGKGVGAIVCEEFPPDPAPATVD